MKNLFCIILAILCSAAVPACSVITGEKPQAAKDVFLPNGQGVKVSVWVEGLDVPWSLLFLGRGRALVSERGGTIRLIREGIPAEKPYMVINVAGVGEAGLMGLAAHPRYPEEPYIYAMHTYEKQGKLFNRVIRLRDRGGAGEFDRVIIDDIPGGSHHDGGRIAFGPDRMLYVATGETFDADLAQDRTSLAGKILRISPDGDIPQDNPFGGSPIYSYGHRNPQGLAWHPDTGALFESEHGPSGEFGKFANDEINIIVAGGNYGWPDIIGAPGLKNYIDPVIVWKETTPPSGITFYRGSLLRHLKGSLFVATLRSESLIRVVFDKNGKTPVQIERWFAEDFRNGKYGRLRDVAEGPDGALYFLANNRDGRGEPAQGDDRIYRIMPE